MTESSLNSAQMAAAFNEWMRRYIAEPDRFAHEFQIVCDFIHAENNGRVPTYGETSAAYMEQIATELLTAAVKP